jgi:hypothetical protein
MGGGERVIATLEHTDERLDGGYRGRADAVGKCARGTFQHPFSAILGWEPSLHLASRK